MSVLSSVPHSQMQVLLKKHLAISNMYALNKCLVYAEINLGSVPYGLNSPFKSYLKFVQVYLSDGPLDHDHDMKNYCMDVRLARRCMCFFVST